MFLPVVIAFCLLTGAIASAEDEELRAEEILKWFPIGKYQVISHSDKARLAEADAYETFIEFFEPPEDSPNSGPLPLVLREGVVSETSARFLELEIRNVTIASRRDLRQVARNSREQGERLNFGSARRQMGEGGPIVVSSVKNTGDTLWVFRYDVLDLQIEKALKKGLLDRTGEFVDRLPVYRIRPKGDENEYFAYVTPTQELLVAGNISNLRLMVKVAAGMEQCLLDHEDYIDLNDHIYGLGQRWAVTPIRTQLRERIEAAEKSETSSELIDLLKDNLERGAQYNIRSWEVGEEIVQRQITIYGDEKQAEESYAQMNSNPQQRRPQLRFARQTRAPKEITEFREAIQTSRKTEIDGARLTTTILFDRNLIEKIRSAREAIAELGDRLGRNFGGRRQRRPE